MQAAFWIVAWFLCVITGMGIGKLIVRGVHFSNCVEEGIFTLAMGWCVWGWVWMCIGFFGGFTRWNLRIATMVVVLATIWGYFRKLKKSWLSQGFKKSILGLIIVIILLIVYWVGPGRLAMYPPRRGDEMNYHFPHIHNYIHYGKIIPDPGATIPIFPMLFHVIFAWGSALAGDRLALMMSHTTSWLVEGALVAWGLRQKWKLPAIFGAVAFWFSQPLVLKLGNSAYVDVALAAIAFLTIYALRVATVENNPKWWYMFAWLTAFMLTTRLQGWMMVPAVGALLLLWGRDLFRRPRLLVGVVLFALMLILPVHIYLFYYTGSPLWPAWRATSYPHWNSQTVTDWFHLIQGIKPVRGKDTLLLPWWMAFRSERLAAPNTLNVFILLLYPLLLLFIFQPRSRFLLTGAGIFTLAWLTQSQQLRFWMPALPLVAGGIGHLYHEVQQWFEDLGWKKMGVLIVLIPGLATTFMGLHEWSKDFKFLGPWPLNRESEERFYRDKFDTYDAVKFLQSNSLPDDKVYLINGWQMRYFMPPGSVEAVALIESGLTFQKYWDASDHGLIMLLRPYSGFGASLASRGFRWVFIRWTHIARSIYIDPKSDLWQFYRPVWMDSRAWIFQRTQQGTYYLPPTEISINKNCYRGKEITYDVNPDIMRKRKFLMLGWKARWLGKSKNPWDIRSLTISGLKIPNGDARLGLRGKTLPYFIAAGYRASRSIRWLSDVPFELCDIQWYTLDEPLPTLYPHEEAQNNLK